MEMANQILDSGHMDLVRWCTGPIRCMPAIEMPNQIPDSRHMDPVRWCTTQLDFGIFLQGRGNDYETFWSYKRTPMAHIFITQAYQEPLYTLTLCHNAFL
jgi:hypothetical protein